MDNAPVFFALETQTRPVYSPVFFSGGPDDFVVVHELAHQWYGDSLAVHAWQHIWLNKGFATYAEWLWSEREGFETAQEIFDFCTRLIRSTRATGTCRSAIPGPDHLFDGQVYSRGARPCTHSGSRSVIADFFRILQRWARSQPAATSRAASSSRSPRRSRASSWMSFRGGCSGPIGGRRSERRCRPTELERGKAKKEAGGRCARCSSDFGPGPAVDDRAKARRASRGREPEAPCTGCDDPHMVEYGNAVDQGSKAAGQGSGVGSGGADLGAGAVNFVNDTVDQVAALPPGMLLLLAVVILAGLYFLRRAL